MCFIIGPLLTLQYPVDFASCPIDVIINTAHHYVGFDVQALTATEPTIKVMKLDAEQAPVVTLRSFESTARGTVNIIDCEDSWLDLHSIKQIINFIDATWIAFRCRLVMGHQAPGFAQSWAIDSAVYRPCNVRFHPQAFKLCVSRIKIKFK
jgi:hypothetical protein